MAEVRWASLEGVGEESIGQSLQPTPMFWRNGVPGLGGTKVEVVNAEGESI